MAEKTNITNTDFYFELIARELNGGISENEKNILLEWVNKKEENRVLYVQTVNAWKATEVKNEIPDFNTEEAWTKIKAGTRLAESTETGKVISINSYSLVYKVAASILFIAGIVTLMKITLWNAKTPEPIAFTTQENELELYLPDSSKVLLNKNSSLTYYTDFNEEGRKVYLEGEAFFEVKKTQGKTFEVFGLRSVTTVLGTSFSVRTLKNEPKEMVQVVTGKVSFADILNQEKKKVLLLPGYMGVLDQAGVLTKNEIKDPNFVAWKENRLAFDNTPMSQVTKTLEAYFGIEIEVKDPLLLNCRYTGTFENPKQDELLEVLALSTGSSYQVSGTKITLTGKGCKD